MTLSRIQGCSLHQQSISNQVSSLKAPGSWFVVLFLTFSESRHVSLTSPHCYYYNVSLLLFSHGNFKTKLWTCIIRLYLVVSATLQFIWSQWMLCYPALTHLHLYLTSVQFLSQFFFSNQVIGTTLWPFAVSLPPICPWGFDLHWEASISSLIPSEKREDADGSHRAG